MLMAAEGHLESGVDPGSEVDFSSTRVKYAARMCAFPASGANLPVPPPIEIIRGTKTN